jgi:hypothetical protein
MPLGRSSELNATVFAATFLVMLPHFQEITAAVKLGGCVDTQTFERYTYVPVTRFGRSQIRLIYLQ